MSELQTAADGNGDPDRSRASTEARTRRWPRSSPSRPPARSSSAASAHDRWPSFGLPLAEVDLRSRRASTRARCSPSPTSCAARSSWSRRMSRSTRRRPARPATPAGPLPIPRRRRSIADRGPGSSSAAVRVGSARRRRPPRSPSAPPRPGARWSCSPSTRPAGWPSRSASASWTTPRVRSPASTTGAGGSLDAMMLDMKRTFDEVVLAHSDAARRAGRSCRTRSTRRCRPQFSGTQEYMAMEKLGQLHAEAVDRRTLGPDRGRHPAGPVGAGLPGRARAPQLAAGRAVPEGCCWPAPGARSGW